MLTTHQKAQLLLIKAVIVKFACWRPHMAERGNTFKTFKFKYPEILTRTFTELNTASLMF